MNQFKEIFSNLLSLYLLTIGLAFGAFSMPAADLITENLAWVSGDGFSNPNDLIQTEFKAFQSQVESFNYPVDLFSFLIYPSFVSVVDACSLIIDWWKLRLVFFDIFRELFPHHFFW